VITDRGWRIRATPRRPQRQQQGCGKAAAARVGRATQVW